MANSRSLMYRAHLFVSFSVLSLFLNGCTGISVASPATIAQAIDGTITIVAQSAPSKSITVQSLRIQVTSAILSPGNVQLVTTPTTIDLAMTTAGSTFLSTASVPAGKYTSLAVTFYHPSLSVTNTSSTPMTIPGGSCNILQTCTFIPALTTNQANIAGGVLPLTIVAGLANSFALTLDVGKILQTDGSLDFSSGVSTGQAQAGTSGITSSSGNVPLDSEIGVVQSVANGQLILQSETNDITPAMMIDSNTVFNYPTALCAANNSSCVTLGEIVMVTPSLTPSGLLHADTLSFADLANTRLLQGTILATSPVTNSFQIIINQAFGFIGTTLPDDSRATIFLQPSTAFGISSIGYPTIPSNAVFRSTKDITVGQTVLVDVGITDQLPNVTSDRILLTDSTASGTISSLTSNSLFTLTNYSAEQDNSSPLTSVTAIQAGSDTLFRNLSPAAFSSLANGNSVSVTGPLFNTSSTPTLAAAQISLHSNSDQ